MADLADKIDDLICIFDGVDATLDTVAMYAFGIFVLLLVLLVISYHLYGKYKKPSKNIASQPVTEKAQLVNNLDTKAPTKETQKNAAPAIGNKVPATPPTRKRLGSKSGKVNMVLTKQKSINMSLPPIATGPETESVKWVNDVLFWLYSDLNVVNELSSIWIRSLNEFMKDSVAEHGVGVELIRLLQETHPPSLNNIFCECASNDDVTITCDCEATAAMQLKAFRQRGEKVEVSHYRVNINKLRGRLHIICIPEKLQCEVKFDGWPEVKILLAQVGSIKNNNLDEQSLQDVIVEIITAAVRSTQVKFNLSQYASCPRFKRHQTTATYLLPLHYDSLLSSPNSKVGDKLLVKVVKASGITPNSKNADGLLLYCVVEVDNPAQTYHTSTLQNVGDSATWNEHFLFNINGKSKEIMFEIYNKAKSEESKDQFMGLAIVGVEELIDHSFQRQVISLQSRPYQNDSVSGTLTLEFTFIETTTNNNNNNITRDNKLAEKVEDYANNGLVTTTKTVYTNKDYLVNGLTELGSKNMEHAKKSYSVVTNTTNSSNKSTLIIHSVQKQSQPNAKKDGVAEIGKEPSSWKSNQENDQMQQQDSPDSHLNGDEISDRGRRRKRDFFGTIRRRLNKSKVRSKSVDKNTFNGTAGKGEINSVTNSPSSRSISVDRGRDHSSHSGHSTKYLTVGPLPREGSARSSISEMSGVSGASSRTYLNDASTLVLETTENGAKKYYLVPLSLAQKNKWRKKGTKLHIFNDHIFVAKHLPGGTICTICNRALPRRLGKQGYECRDCTLKCHKQCHVKMDSNCPNSSVQQLELNGCFKLPQKVVTG